MLKSGAIKERFRIENLSSSLADSRGGDERLPPSAGMVREYPIGARVNVAAISVDTPAKTMVYRFVCVALRFLEEFSFKQVRSPFLRNT